METHGGNALYFIDSDCNNLLTIDKGFSQANDFAKLLLLDNISFFRNQLGSNSFIIGESDGKHCLFSDEGDIQCNYIYCDGSITSTMTITAYESIECTDGPVSGTAFVNTSRVETKKNIEKYDKNAINEIINTDIYEFNYKSEKDKSKKHIGFVIGENYNYSNDIVAVDKDKKEIGVDTYSMISVAYKAIQEQQEEIEELKEKDRQKDILIQTLIERIERLEKEIKDGKDKL
ncbi:MAG: tail fiber domain-containing protein [Clostridia bacterium]|nr:tail fiber domain-containing protein [Clostridia bacterium]